MLRTEKVRSQCRLRTETKPGKDGGSGGPPAGGSPAHKAPLPHDLDSGRRVDLDDRFALFVAESPDGQRAIYLSSGRKRLK